MAKEEIDGTDPLLKALDKFFVAGCSVVAIGWCEGKADPVILLDGAQLPSQSVERLERADVAKVHGPALSSSGFRICALIPDTCDHSKLTVRFPDNIELSVATTKTGTLYESLERFKLLVQKNPEGHMIEIGSRARSGNTYRSLFPTLKNYTGLDVADGPNVDVVGDAHQASRFFEKKFDFCFSISVFEHLIMPWVVAFELNKIMKLGGLGYIQSHQSWPLHEIPWDFFRFSEHSWHGLFNEFTGFEIVETGYEYPAMITSESIHGRIFENLDKSSCFLLSGCIIRKISEPSVDWSADASKIYNLSYSH